MRNAFGIESHGDISKKSPSSMLNMAMEPGKKIAAAYGPKTTGASQMNAVRGTKGGTSWGGKTSVNPRPLGAAPAATPGFKEKAALKFKPIKDWTKDNPWKTAGIAAGTSAVGGAGAAYGAKKR